MGSGGMGGGGTAIPNAPLKSNEKAQETPEYIRQKTICEHHKKIAFDTTRCMFEEELLAFRLSDSEESTETLTGSFNFTKTCL